ncbi:phenylacetate--CoA ligase family protein [Mycolicibacterium palauense]|uniref:phenylacetate--CoA ligase family protein n=1 Tax=Mycolicibacterium palauense TaxID=2034511 RepID=UPI000BFED3D2|nr:phenylacetate--CoA ligase family protein [Mycolicibacterium palauense]
MWRARWADAPAIRVRQERRLADLIGYARAHSRFYGRLYSDLPVEPGAFSAYPPVTKPMLMERFDDVVTDTAVTRAGVEAFLADPGNIGRRFLGRYPVWTTSGTTGEPGVFVQDDLSLKLVHTLPDRWTTPAVLNAAMLGRLIRNNLRGAEIAVSGGHFAGASGIALVQRESRFYRNRIRLFSPSSPIGDLVAELNDYQPASLIGYSTVLLELARAQRQGRLAISPAMIVPTAEPISAAEKTQLREIFGCVVREMYGATEAVTLAVECGSESLHVNSDWFLLEPVDEDHRPVPPGQPSDTVLLTNLGNRIQPLIRYDLGDTITLHDEVCPCGSAFPVMTVQGRQGDVLRFATDAGGEATIFPLALTTLVEGVPGVVRCQLIRTDPSVLRVRFDAEPDRPTAQVWDRIESALREFLHTQHIHGVRIAPADEPPQRNPRSGKFSHVWSDPGL